MTRLRTIKLRLAILTVAALALCSVGSGTAATHTYRPFVTDFPKPAVQAKLDFADFGIARRAPGRSLTAGAHPARILVAREHLATPADVSPSVGAALTPHSGAFAWGAAALGVAVGIALCAAMAAAVTGARSLRRHTLPTH
jgi:hypothetical protein